ncbi:hypothetical protein [uncultured Microbulbifer sp.]|uniref:hypothetical protein n=1 Tax=uncultured Microbulbifer sp. TaxID=348147 RepID=UPI0026372492|nr:hypothetical protein [uncultured Microbulbifer sp.]
MSLLRTDTQAALQALHKVIRESAAHYRFVVEHCARGEGAKRCDELAEERDQLAGQLAEAIRKTGDLPAEPDRDLEAARQLQDELVSQLSGLFDENGAAAMIEHCQQMERQLQTVVQEDAAVLSGSDHESLRGACADSAERARRILDEIVSG